VLRVRLHSLLVVGVCFFSILTLPRALLWLLSPFYGFLVSVALIGMRQMTHEVWAFAEWFISPRKE